MLSPIDPAARRPRRGARPSRRHELIETGGLWLGFAAMLSVSALGCGPDKARDGVGRRPSSPKMSIVSPISGAFLDEGAPVTLEMECRGADGAVTDCLEPSWWIEGDNPGADWQAEGAAVDGSDLPPGAWLLRAACTVAQTDLEDEREINVFAAN